AKQQAAFAAERDRWVAAGEFTRQERLQQTDEETIAPENVLSDGVEAIVAHVSANVWQVLVKGGDRVASGDRLVILEAMKMGVAGLAEDSGTITNVFWQPGQTRTAGQILAANQPD
ncbi:acetyl-CoA carboxylase biotin carboxyl carrier protein subunit, partial [Chroococcidiopsis sp. TS-821]|uniref:acetyl-CoA carboxylase biotin carboxyl carrier protein subunit n=1 Tax=Chroococcidiopsis sp. TS-821 TaxID=1378066 RepID=UPI000D47AB02